MKEEILAFLDWAENNRASYICYDSGYDFHSIYGRELEQLIDDYIKSQEEE